MEIEQTRMEYELKPNIIMNSVDMLKGNAFRNGIKKDISTGKWIWAGGNGTKNNGRFICEIVWSASTGKMHYVSEINIQKMLGEFWK